MIDWVDWFSARRDDLVAARLPELAIALEDAAERHPDAVSGLKGFARRALRGGVPDLDPWAVDATLRRAGLDERARLPRLRLRAAGPPRFGLDEPDLHVRSWALARQWVDAHGTPDAHSPAPPTTAGGAEVVWWLTGRDPSWRNASQARTGLAMARIVARSLEPLALLGAQSSAARLAQLAAWAEHWGAAPAPADRLVADFQSALESEQAPIDRALALALQAFLAPAATDQRLTELRDFLADRFYDETAAEPAPALAQWCARSFAVGLALSLEAVPVDVDVYREKVTAALVAQAERLLPATPLPIASQPVAFPVWRALAVLLRDALAGARRAHAARLTSAIAETGAWTRAVSRELLRMARLLAGEDPAGTGARSLGASYRQELVQRLVSRLAITTCRRRRRSPPEMWRKAMARHARLGPDQREVAMLRRWWDPNGPPAERADLLDLVKVTRLMAGDEWPDGADPGQPVDGQIEAARAWWAGHDQRRLLEGRPAGAERSPVQDVPRLLASRPAGAAGAPSARAPDATGRSLHVDFRFDRYGEALVQMVLFASSGGHVTTRLTSGYYDRPVACTEQLGELSDALDALRQDAARGRLSGSEGASRLLAVRRAVTALAPTPFWTALAEETGTAERLELVVDDDFGTPWELAGLGGVLPDDALAARVICHRARHLPAGAPAPAPSRRRLLALYDPAHEGAEAEVEAVVTAWQDGDPTRTAVTVGHRRELDALGSWQFDAVHYAGHRALAADGTPALRLRGGVLPLVELVERTHRAPPAALFLDACSTLAPSQSLAAAVPGAAPHLVFGGLEPLRQSAIPAIIGTLWDIYPPTDAGLVRRFYRALAAGADGAVALHAALAATWEDDAWMGCREAYVALAP